MEAASRTNARTTNSLYEQIEFPAANGKAEEYSRCGGQADRWERGVDMEPERVGVAAGLVFG